MKQVLFTIAFFTFTLIGFAQQDVLVNNETERIETVKNMESKVEDDAKVSARAKAKVLRMNHKKSNEIISIKAYRKSLQIKVKTVKLC